MGRPLPEEGTQYLQACAKKTTTMSILRVGLLLNFLIYYSSWCLRNDKQPHTRVRGLRGRRGFCLPVLGSGLRCVLSPPRKSCSGSSLRGGPRVFGRHFASEPHSTRTARN